MPLWTDLIDPVEATGIARDEQYVLEQAKGGTLARFLPNVFVDSDHVQFERGATGLVDVARYRSFNAPPEIGKGGPTKLSTITLPAIARNEPIDEMTQKDLARLSDDRVKKSIESAIRRNVQAISMRQELTRGILINTGKVSVDQTNFWIDDDFGRDAALSITAATLWASGAVDRLSAVLAWIEVYKAKNNGAAPGRIVFGGQTAWAAYIAGDQFRTILAGGASRPPLAEDVKQVSLAAGLPPMEVYDRTVNVEGVSTRVLPADKIFLLPEPVDPMDEDGSLLGATYWGRTVSAGFDSWGIEPDEQPGIVCGVFREESVGRSIEVQADSIGEPVAVQANAAMAIKVV